VVIEPGVFVGTLRHRRHTPVSHAFTYRLFMVLLDIDRIPDLMRISRVTSYNRLNWAAFDERDHLGDPALPLRARVAADARRAGLELPDGPIFLLTHLRYLGYCFNPVSFFYLFDRAGHLRLVAAEVNNTFGGARTYWLRPESDSRVFRAAAAKTLEVSPFLPEDLDYRFSLTLPMERHVAHIEAMRLGSNVLDATLSLERRPWTAREIRRCLWGHPAMTAQVMGSIHWQALKLWWRGVPIVPRTQRASGEAKTMERGA
jgi:DUF1365 family protein